MAEESFLMLSLEDEKSKKLAQVISNNTSRKILNELSKTKMTETELSKKLGLSMSTVHYNLKALEEAKLIQADEFHYSEKGKEVNHYSVTNKLVIIAPKSEDNIWDRLKSLLPSFGISVMAAGLLYFFSQKFTAMNNFVKGASYGATNVVVNIMDQSSGVEADTVARTFTKAMPEVVSKGASESVVASVSAVGDSLSLENIVESPLDGVANVLPDDVISENVSRITNSCLNSINDCICGNNSQGFLSVLFSGEYVWVWFLFGVIFLAGTLVLLTFFKKNTT